MGFGKYKLCHIKVSGIKQRGEFHGKPSLTKTIQHLLKIIIANKKNKHYKYLSIYEDKKRQICTFRHHILLL